MTASDPYVLRDARGRYLVVSGTMLRVLRSGQGVRFDPNRTGVPGHWWERGLFYATACPRDWLERYARRRLQSMCIEVLPVVVVRGRPRFLRAETLVDRSTP